ncbi:MAG: outer spore coat protein CotE [Mycobacterium leprae]
MSESRLQEIFARSVVGRAEHRMHWRHTVPAEGITGVLGVHITDARVEAKEEHGHAAISIVIDADVWCGNQRNTKILRVSCPNTDLVDIRTHGHVLGDTNLRAELIRRPRATGVRVAEGEIVISLEADIEVEMTALARLWVKVYDVEETTIEDATESTESTHSTTGTRTTGITYTDTATETETFTDTFTDTTDTTDVSE